MQHTPDDSQSFIQLMKKNIILKCEEEEEGKRAKMKQKFGQGHGRSNTVNLPISKNFFVVVLKWKRQYEMIVVSNGRHLMMKKTLLIDPNLFYLKSQMIQQERIP